MSNLAKIPVVFLMMVNYLQVVSADHDPQRLAQEVLDKLYKAHGNFSSQKPKLIYKSGKENVARYLKYNNTIELEDQAFQLCRSFGKDSLDALAFILGHELIHATQVKNTLPKTSFIAYDKSLKSSLQIEQNADIQGIFISYLAGYNTIRIIPELISKMYTVYGLRNKNIVGYPTEDERKTSYIPVLEQATTLIELFKLSNELSVIEEYQASIQCLEYITRLYQGKEVYNNLGVNYALLALNFTPRNTEGYIYPLELDWYPRIKKPKTGRGEEDLDPLIKIQQQQMFTKAKDYFRLATQLDPAYALGELNLFCVLIMMNDFKNARDYHQKELRKLSNRPSIGDIHLKIKSANAILLAKMNKTTEAISIWQSLTKEKNAIIAIQAEQNLSNQLKGKYTWINPVENTCRLDEFKDIADTKLKLRNAITNSWIQLDSTLRIEKNITGNTAIYTHILDDQKLLTIQKIKLPGTKLNRVPDPLHSLGNKEWIYLCKKDKTALLLNEQFELVGIIRYYPFKEIFE